MVKDMTKGKPLPIIIKFTIPLLLGTVFQQFYNMADMMIVGRFIGDEALAAVGTTGSLNFLVIGFVIGICAGFCIPIAQKFGAGDIKEMRRFAANAVYLCVFFGIVVTTLTVIFSRQFLVWIDVPPEIINYSHSYIIFIFAGIPAAMTYNILASLLRALGDSRSPLYFLAISSVVNVALDLLFIVVLGFNELEDVRYIGLATVIAQSVSAILCFIYIRRKFPILQFEKDEKAFSLPHAKKLLSMGLPMGLQFSITALGTVILQRAINGLGTVAIASLTAGNRIAWMFFIPTEMLGLTMATFCGQNLGAKKLGRIRRGMRISMTMQMIFCAAAGVILYIFGRSLAGIFVSADTPEELLRITQIFDNVQIHLRLTGLFMPFLGVLFLLRNALQGLGYSFFAMSAGVCELGARLIVAFLLVPRWGFVGACFSNPIAWVMADMLLIPAYIIIIKRLKKKIREPAEPELITT